MVLSGGIITMIIKDPHYQVDDHAWKNHKYGIYAQGKTVLHFPWDAHAIKMGRSMATQMRVRSRSKGPAGFSLHMFAFLGSLLNLKLLFAGGAQSTDHQRYFYGLWGAGEGGEAEVCGI